MHQQMSLNVRADKIKQIVQDVGTNAELCVHSPIGSCLSGENQSLKRKARRAPGLVGAKRQVQALVCPCRLRLPLNSVISHKLKRGGKKNVSMGRF